MAPEALGPYRIDREIGSGGMGKVYAATLTREAAGLAPGTTVALKVVHPHLLETDGFFERFLREAEIGASVRHENVVRTFSGDALSGHHFLVMEYVEGQTLADLQRELDRVPEELCRHVGREVCKGLAAIHGAGVVHRDLKPDNVLITPDHVVKVMDLGVARLADEAIRLSQTGAFVGSVEYAAPEQFKGADVDARTDLYALGVLLYEIAAGVHPHRGGGFAAVMRRVISEEPRPLGEVNPQVSAFFEEVVHTLLVKDPRGRFTSATQLLAVLDEGEDCEWWRERSRAMRAETKRPLRRIRIPRETAVYGRENDIATLRALFARAKSGDGQVVLIEGEAGVGKSRLVDELIGRLQSDGEDLNFLFGGYPPGGAASSASGFSSAYREQFGETGSASYLAETPLLVPGFDAVLRGEPAPSSALELTTDSLGTCFVHATRNLAAERMTVVLIEDLHFAPEEARALFAALALAVSEHRVVLIGTARPGVPEDWVANLSRLDHTTHMEIARLGPKDLMGLLQDSFSSDQLASDLCGQVALKSDGNPFFAFEIIRGLREGQFITQIPDGSWVQTQVVDDIQIPSTVLDLVSARVSSLSEEERDLLDVACCWGFEFDPLLVSDVLGIARIPLLKRLGQIERRHRLVRSAGVRYVFDHHQVQEGLYGSLSELLRREHHSALAEALETRTNAADQDPETLDGALCVDLCDHFLKGARGESALRYLDAAQTHLTKGYLHVQIVALSERALAVPDLLTGAERAKVLLRSARALNLLGRRTQQEDCAREAERVAGEAGDDALRGQAARELGICLDRTSRHADAEAAFRRALDAAIACGDRQAEANATGSLGVVFLSQGRLEESREHYERHLALSREIGDRRGEAVSTGNLGLIFQSEGRLAEALAQHGRHLALSREIGDRNGEVVAIGNLGVVLQSQGRLAEAREHHERELALSRAIGSRESEAAATGCLGVVCQSEGRPAEARAHYERRLALSREIGDREGETRATGNLGNVFQSEGRLAEAREHHERHLVLSREIGYRHGAAVALHNLGNVLAESGDTAFAEERLGECVALAEEIGLRHLVAATHLALGSLRAEVGDEAGGRTSLAAARDLSAEQGFAGYETLARCHLACLPGGDTAAALAAFTEHDERLDAEERLGARWLLFRATADRAHLEEAKRLLDESVAHVDAETRESMLTNLRVNREIMAVWRAELGGDDDDSDLSETRAG